MQAKRQIAIIGAGFIAAAHTAALGRRKDMEIAAVVDPNRERAEELASRSGGRVFPDVAALITAMRPDAAHVLTPPPLHVATAEPLLKAGISVLLEKPMAETAEQCARLVAAARAGGAALAVNHNFIFHPAFLKAKALVEARRFGSCRRISARYAAPLRQMSAGQFGHWMFESPRNLLLEQAVHPLSQIDAMLGGIVDVEATPGPRRRPAEGIEVFPDWLLNLKGRDGLAQLDIALGATFPNWTLSLLCDDGVIDVDIYEGRVAAHGAHAAIPSIDYAQRNFDEGLAGAAAGLGGLVGFARELARLGPPSDGFNRSMAGSINAFHDDLARGEQPVSETGARLVAVCEHAARRIMFSAPRRTAAPAADETYDAAILGGTGFIGRHLVHALLDEGLRVAVLARNAANLPGLFHKKRVSVFQGSTSDRAALDQILRRSRAAVNLAHGGGGATRDAIAEAMVGAAKAAADAARSAGVERVIFISSSAALYLGDARETVTMATPVDPCPEQRGDYARAKILSEHAMVEFASFTANLRPAIVVGEGGTPFHSALGAFENETHCMGWNAGWNPLPFVLARDVAQAILACLKADLSLVAGKTFNIVGDVRWSARRYIAELAAATGRPLRFHPSNGIGLMAAEWAKHGVKTIAGRRNLQPPSMRDIKSRGMVAAIDVSEEKRILGWTPCADEAEFRRLALGPHAK